MLVVIDIPDEILENNKSDSWCEYSQVEGYINIDEDGCFCGFNIFDGNNERPLNWDTIRL